MTRTTIANARLSAEIDAHGAELCSLRPAGGAELVWQGGDAWKRHAPVLFPIVGRLNNDRLSFAGRTYEMPQHGFARDRDFERVASDERSCSFALEDDEASRAIYPFRFRLTVAYALDGDTLGVTYTIANPGEEALFASIGAHPAFCWPLVPGTDKSAHRLVFDTNENGPVRALDQGLMRHAPVDSPLGGGTTLALDPALFGNDAVIMQRIASRWVRFEAPAGASGEATSVRIGWEGFDRLALWSRPEGEGTADFLCIEPWSGNADPVGFEGEFQSKPGILRIAPGDALERRMTITPAGHG